jgi:multidrug transporter EmrE-like cation transporter
MGKKEILTWYRMMMLAFMTNGLGVFGTRILAGWDLAEQYKFQYLVLWYGSGFLLAALLFLREGFSFEWREMTIACLMGLASVGGQLSLLNALQKGIPGHVAFPIANGGGLFVVVLVGILSFGERLHGYGIAGILLGIVASVLLSLP